jgi:hypothetical protein
MNNVKYKDNMSQSELDILMKQIEAIDLAYADSDVFESLYSYDDEGSDEEYSE